MICRECKSKFVFHSDIEDHKDSTGHKVTEKVMMLTMVSSVEALEECYGSVRLIGIIHRIPID